MVFHSLTIVRSCNGTCERYAARAIICAPTGPLRKTNTIVSSSFGGNRQDSDFAHSIIATEVDHDDVDHVTSAAEAQAMLKKVTGDRGVERVAVSDEQQNDDQASVPPSTGSGQHTRKSPAFTIVAECRYALTGVGAAMAVGNQKCKGNCADVAPAPTNTRPTIIG
jgi:hypothetical protein